MLYQTGGFCGTFVEQIFKNTINLLRGTKYKINLKKRSKTASIGGFCEVYYSELRLT